MIPMSPKEIAESKIDVIEDRRGKYVARIDGIVVKSCGGNGDEAGGLVKWMRIGVIRILEDREREFNERLQREFQNQLDRINDD